jgi:hypothetical protein
VFVSSLRRRAADDNALAHRLSQYKIEADPAVRTSAAIAYYEAIATDETVRSASVAALKEEVEAIGPWMDAIRQAALAGFIVLEQLPVFADMPDWQTDKKLSVDVFMLENNRPIVTYVASIGIS